jgi:hypothetical protein
MLLGSTPHQDRFAVEEDLIETADQHQPFAVAIESLENHTRGFSRGLDPAMHRGATGTRLSAQENHQQDHDLVMAEPHGQGGDRERLLLDQRKVNGLEQPFPHLSEFPTQGGVLPDQFLIGRSAAVLGLDGRFHLLSMVIDGLPTAVGLLGLGCDRAARAVEACGGIGDPTAEG